LWQSILVLHGLRHRGVASTTKNRVLPKLCQAGVAPRSRYMCKYTHLAPVIYPGFAKGVSSSIVHCISKTTFLPTLRIPLGWMNSECLPYCWNSASKSHRHLLDYFKIIQIGSHKKKPDKKDHLSKTNVWRDLWMCILLNVFQKLLIPLWLQCSSRNLHTPISNT
jgi:hypothetical protein